jgi:two-component system, cell cycle sensor histidine kinase and response regulator CckA
MGDELPRARVAAESGVFPAAEPEAVLELRQRALEREQSRHTPIPVDLSTLSAEDARSLLHDLRVHRIELELQNEELRTSQEALEVARARYFELYDLAPVGYVTIGENGIVLEANLTAAGLLDATRSAIVKQPWSRFVFPDDQDIYFKHRRQLLASGAPHGCELRLLKSNGDCFWVALEARVADGDARTRVCRTVLSDISDRKRAEETLRASDARHRTLFQNSPDALLTLTPPDWSFSSCNAASIAMFGARDEQDLLARSFAHYSRERQPDNRLSLERSSALLGAALQDGSASFEWTFQRRAAEEFTATVVVARMQAAGTSFLQATVRDETEARKQHAASAQTERLASMGLLAASMGHEINNPLTYVLSNVEELAHLLPKFGALIERCSAAIRRAVGEHAFNAIVGEDSAWLEPSTWHEVCERASDALEGARRITSISKALGSFGRVEAADLSKVDLRQAIESAVAMSSNEIRFRATLTLDFEPTAMVWASEGKLSQVFLNLLINASHAMAQSEDRAIVVRTWTADDRVCAAVEDSGAGIAAKDLPHIFEPFFSTKPIGAGSGLGLAICRNIIEEFGGDIRIESEPGKGTRVIVRLPAYSELAVVRSTLAPSETEALPNLRGRILIVDDEAQLRGVMQRLLVAHDVVTATSGKEALSILEHDRAFDLILCDLMMPEVTGMDVHRWLVLRDPTLAARLVFITGGVFGPVAAEYLHDAGNLKLDKPFSNERFKDVVSRRIRAARSEPPRGLDVPTRTILGES